MKRFLSPVLLFALLFPFCLTLIYFVLLADAPPLIQKSAYAVGKVIQFSLPVFWIALVFRERVLPRLPNRNGLLEGFLFGVLVFVLILLFYYFMQQPGGAFAADSSAREAVISKISGFGLTAPAAFILLGLFYSFIHSGLEEYYWRWFVYRKLACPAVVSALGFTAHHVILLGTYFGYTSLLCWSASFGVFIGGIYWCRLYRRSGSVYGAWLGHALIDAAIFTVGYLLIQT